MDCRSGHIVEHLFDYCNSRKYLLKTKSDVYPVRWSIVGLHFTSLIIGALPYPIYTMFKPSFSLKFQHFYEQVGWPSAALMVMLIATELVFMYLQARNGMKSEMERKLSQAIKD